MLKVKLERLEDEEKSRDTVMRILQKEAEEKRSEDAAAMARDVEIDSAMGVPPEPKAAPTRMQPQLLQRPPCPPIPSGAIPQTQLNLEIKIEQVTKIRLVPEEATEVIQEEKSRFGIASFRPASAASGYCPVMARYSTPATFFTCPRTETSPPQTYLTLGSLLQHS